MVRLAQGLVSSGSSSWLSSWFLGGGPDDELLRWKNPGPVNQHAIGGASGHLAAFCGTVTFSVFAVAFAPELLVVTGGEKASTRRNLPIAGER